MMLKLIREAAPEYIARFPHSYTLTPASVPFYSDENKKRRKLLFAIDVCFSSFLRNKKGKKTNKVLTVSMHA